MKWYCFHKIILYSIKQPYSQIFQLSASILPAFLDPAATQTIIVCNPAAIEEIVTEFAEFGIDLHHIQDLEESYLVS